MTTADDGWDETPAKGGLSPEPDFRPLPSTKPKTRRGGVGLLATVLVLAIAAGAGGWYVLNNWLITDDLDAEVPLVRADTGPIKVRPEEPGGLDVPDRDKLVYDRIDENEERKTVERLLPPPEVPLAKPAPEAGEPVGEQAAPPPSETAVAPVAPVPPVQSPPAVAEPPQAPGQAAPAPVSPARPADRVVPSVEDVLTAMRPPPPIDPQQQETAVDAKAKAEAAKKAAPAKAGGYQVQLAALRNREQADAEWDRLRRRNSDLLGNLDLSVVRADLGPDKGVFFRLRAGPLADEPAAKNLCQKLSERKIGCLVVRPEG